MKNLITDKPAPITVKLAQTTGVPETVEKTKDQQLSQESANKEAKAQALMK